MIRTTLLTFFLLSSLSGFTQIAGRWKTIDDNSGQPRSIIEITERSGKYFGKVIKIFPQPGEDPDPVCDKCSDTDARYKKKVIGMEILKELVKDGEEFTGGHILDPENGKVYKCKLWLEGKILKVRGYWGPFFRTQTWHADASHP
ncbi:MAG: DUF2147 domain-containing protein [Bacteroidetes bacterium]|nr:DUF2147 domain-containing protein [Bacteroidota bacterium]